MNKRRRSNWYIYVITFVVTGLLLILVSSILLKSFYDSQDKDATVNVSQNQTAIFTPDSTYDFSVLVTLSADNDKTPDKYMTISYIAKNNTFVLMPYLPNAVIDGGNTIKQICEQSGEAEVAKLLSSKTGLSINKYIRFTKSTLTELFDMVGNTTLTVPSEIKYENKKDNTVTIIKQGTQIFTAEQMYAYLTLPDYGVKDILYPCKLNATVISSFIDQNFIGTSSKTLDEYINFIINFTNTNIEQSDYDAKIKAIVYTLSQNKSSVTDFYIPYGDKSGDDYIIDDNSWNSAKKAVGIG